MDMDSTDTKRTWTNDGSATDGTGQDTGTTEDNARSPTASWGERSDTTHDQIQLLRRWGTGQYTGWVEAVLTKGAPAYVSDGVWDGPAYINDKHSEEKSTGTEVAAGGEDSATVALELSIKEDLHAGVLIDITDAIEDGSIKSLQPAKVSMRPKKNGTYRRIEDYSDWRRDGRKHGVNQFISVEGIPGGCPMADLRHLPAVLYQLKEKYGTIHLSVCDFKNYFKQIRLQEADRNLFQMRH